MWNPKQSTKPSKVKIGTTGQGTPRQRDLEPSETTHRQGRHTGQMGLQSEIETQWSTELIQSALCGERLQTSGKTGLL